MSIILSCFVIKPCLSNHFLTTDPALKLAVGQCVSDIIKNVVPCGDILTYVNLRIDTFNFIHSVNHRLCYNIEVRNFKRCNMHVHSDVYIILVDNADELRDGLACLTLDVYWNSTGKAIIVVTYSVDKQMLKILFKILLNENVFNVILLATLQNENVTSIFTYNPFRKHRCGRKIGTVMKKGNCNCLKNNTDEYFPKKIKNGLRNCTIVVAATEDIPFFIIPGDKYELDGQPILGIEQVIIESVAKAENFSVHYKMLEPREAYGVIHKNGTTTGGLNFLESRISDVSAGGLILIQNRVQAFDYVWGYYYASHKLYTHTTVGNRWKNVYREFSSGTWILIASSFLAILALSYYITLIANKIGIKLYDGVYLILHLWGYFFANTSDRLNNRKLFRCVLVSWIWLTFFVGHFYTTALYSLITANKWPSHYHDFNDLVQQGYQPCVSKSTKEFFEFAYNMSINSSERDECQRNEDSLSIVSKETNSYAIDVDYAYKLRECEYYDDEGNKLLNEQEFSGNHVMVFMLHRGSVLTPIFQKYVRILFDSGLLRKQENDISLENQLTCQKTTNVFHNLRLGDLKLAFMILFVGSGISFFIFLCEIRMKQYI